MRDNVSERLFSLFTSSDRAEAMAGDLMEEREKRGPIWFWLHVTRITLTLWRNRAAEAPLRVLALAAAGCALFAAPALGGAAAFGMFPQFMGSLVSWITLSVFWWGGSLWIGASLVTMAPRHGMAACATLVAAAAALVIAVGITAVWRGVLDAELLPVYTIGLLIPAPLLAGAALARRRMITSVNPALEERR